MPKRPAPLTEIAEMLAFYKNMAERSNAAARDRRTPQPPKRPARGAYSRSETGAVVRDNARHQTRRGRGRSYTA